MDQLEKHVFDAIYARRSVRRYMEDKEVEHEKIIKLLKAAMAAPSACNIQPWEFIVINEKEAVADFKKCVEQHGNYNAPLIIVVCGYTGFIPWDNDEGEYDCCAAIENMHIAAVSMGLGSVWIGGFNQDTIRKQLNIPEDVYPIGIVYFGYPKEIPEPRTQYREEAVFWQKYDPEREHNPAVGNLVYKGKK